MDVSQLTCILKMKFVFSSLMLLFSFVIFFNSCQTNKIKKSQTNQSRIITETTTDKYWIFLMAGQSNMAGRAIIEKEDSNDNPKILSINSNNEWIVAQEPLHFYEPPFAGLDCGVSFGREVLQGKPDSFHVVLIPCAVGGTSIEQWLGDSLWRGVKLLSNFREKVKLAQSLGPIKGILWHQGENNANQQSVDSYLSNLRSLVDTCRQIVRNDSLPFFLGNLGSFAKDEQTQIYWDELNQQMFELTKQRKQVYVIPTADLTDKGDHLHFDSKSQRLLGKKFAFAVNLIMK